MYRNSRYLLLFSVLFLALGFSNCVVAQPGNQEVNHPEKKQKKKKAKKVKLPDIDLSHWKVTLPIANEEGKPYEIEPPEILDFADHDIAKPYMYIDSAAGAIVFHAMPTSSTTRNTKYSRCELREQMMPGSNSTNWTFADGGNLKARIAMESCSRASDGKYHKTIILQIHGRLTNEQRDLIGEDDNNAPPILKIYWDNGKIRIKSKVLANPNASDEALLHEDAWDNDLGYTFPTEVGFGKFTLEVQVSEGKMVVILNNLEYKVYQDLTMERWGIFENYFKAGNYFQTRDEGAHSKVKFYKLEISH
ncbi:MAG: polysaccharide lyase family 7 protein [Bacteroidota bacterium]